MDESKPNDGTSEDRSRHHLPSVKDAPSQTFMARIARGTVVLAYGLLVGMILLVVLDFVGATIQSSGGATRSSKLKFAERQAAIEQALQERQASEIGDNRTGDEHGDPPATNTNIHPR